MSEFTRVTEGYLSGKLLVAAPGAEGEFEGCVLAVCNHTHEGAMTIVLNKPIEGSSLGKVMVDLKVAAEGAHLPESLRKAPLLKGGTACGTTGFVIHSSDYTGDDTRNITPDLCLSTRMDILRAMVDGSGPAKALMAVGCMGWQAGTLEESLHGGDWLVCDMDEALVFGVGPERAHAKAIESMGIDLVHLHHGVGRA